MTDGFLLSQADVIALRKMIRWWKIQTANHSNEPEYRGFRTSDIYIAKIPIDGIPPLDDTGTGGDIAGYADCDIYRINQDSGVLEKYPDFVNKRVWNISPTEISGGNGQYVLVSRAKNGAWIASTAGAGGSDEWIDFELAEDFNEGDPTVQGYVVEYIDTGETPGTGTVTLLNKMDAAFFGKTGFRGLARKVGVDQYLIVQLYQDCIETGTGS